MRGLRSTLILLVVALGLGGYLYFIDAERPVEDENAKRKVFTYDAEKIQQLQITSSSGDVTALRKDAAGTWALVRPVEAPADRNNVSDVVTNLANLEEDRVVEENASDLTVYGLAQPRIDVTFNVEGESEPKRILVGDKNPTGVGLYAKLAGDNRVFIVASSLEVTLDRSSFDLRDKTALAFDQEKIDSIALASGARTIRLEKSGQEWKLVQPVQAPADFVAVQGLIGQLQSAQMTSLKDQPQDLKDLGQYGLDKPVVVATLGMGASAITLELGGAADGAGVWARDRARPAVFSLGSGLADELRKTAFDFRRKEIFEFRPFNTTRFEITRGQDTRAFERVKGTGENAVDTWKQVVPADKTVDSSNFEGALLEFSNLRAESFADRAPSSASPAVATITVKFDDGKKEERVTFARTGGDVLATRPDQPGAMQAEMGKFDAAIQKLDSIQ